MCILSGFLIFVEYLRIIFDFMNFVFFVSFVVVFLIYLYCICVVLKEGLKFFTSTRLIFKDVVLMDMERCFL